MKIKWRRYVRESSTHGDKNSHQISDGVCEKKTPLRRSTRCWGNNIKWITRNWHVPCQVDSCCSRRGAVIGCCVHCNWRFRYREVEGKVIKQVSSYSRVRKDSVPQRWVLSCSLLRFGMYLGLIPPTWFRELWRATYYEIFHSQWPA